MANPSGRGAPDKQVLYEQLVDTMNAIFGMHPGYRAIHAKGAICEGTFRPSREAATLTRAMHFAGGDVPITVRFSNFSGIPTIPDGDPSASPRGLSIRFYLSDDSATDIVAHSYDGFPARTPEEFLGFLHALASSGPEAGRPTPLETFLASHPAAQAFVEAPKPIPCSFATEAYYGVDTFLFSNRQGASRYGRYRIVPAAGTKYLESMDAVSQPASFLFDELSDRLLDKPIEFRLIAQLAFPEDTLDDPSASWPDRRPLLELGNLRITSEVAGSAAIERVVVFDPAHLVDGIEPGDRLLEARSAIYAIAGRRRGARI